jgi:CubicO group peptidase (beta-lactamase class C family)
VLFGGRGASGTLPVSISGFCAEGTGRITAGLQRLRYTAPHEAGMDEGILYKIDSIAQHAMDEKAMPGCQVLAARNGNVFYHKSFGHHTYRKRQQLNRYHVYDLASVTKVAATLPCIMHLVDQGQLKLNDKLKEHWPELDTSAMGELVISDILLHQAGLKAWIPFYLNTLEPIYPWQKLYSTNYSRSYPIQLSKHFYANKHLSLRSGFYTYNRDENHPYQVSDHMFMRRDLKDTIIQTIINNGLNGNEDYLYSDLGFYLLQHIIEAKFNMPLNQVTDSLFYRPLGLKHLTYNPENRFGMEHIVPTENDLIFRKKIVHGYVHDPGAAMLGGVAGHAGLFANANDLAKLFQMYLNKGEYGGERFISEKIIEKFTEYGNLRKNNRRGLGFDKPQPDTSKASPVIKEIPHESFGHTGFTGTMAWADPKNGILYIFLSNRIHPDVMNTKLITMNVRTEIQQVIYDELLEE